MNKHVKNIIITFAIGIIVFIIGNLMSDGFDFENTKEFFVEFSKLWIFKTFSFSQKGAKINRRFHGANDILRCIEVLQLKSFEFYL